MNIVKIEFKDDAKLSNFIKVLMDSENGNCCFIRIGYDGVNHYIELKPQFENNI